MITDPVLCSIGIACVVLVAGVIWSEWLQARQQREREFRQRYATTTIDISALSGPVERREEREALNRAIDRLVASAPPDFSGLARALRNEFSEDAYDEAAERQTQVLERNADRRVRQRQMRRVK